MPNTQDRIRISGTLYHQNAGSNPTNIDLGCTRPVLTYEEPYSRTPPQGTGDREVELDFGWLQDKTSMIVLVNNEEAHPADKDWEAKTLYLRFAGDDNWRMRVRPGMKTVLDVVHGERLKVKSDQPVQYSVHVLPE